MKVAPYLLALPLMPLLSLSAAEPPALPAGYKLVWSDEFDKPGAPDPTKWRYEVGLVRNKELQYYTENRRENVRVEGGYLILEGIKEEFPNAKYKEGSDKWQQAEKTAHYTSGSIETQDLASWTYGRIEVRAQVPAGKGMWPAVWMLGDSISELGWPKCGEIDVMEYVGKEPNHIYGTLHWHSVEKNKHESLGGKIVMTDPQPHEGFHIFTVDWTPEEMKFYCDDQLVHSMKLDKPSLGEGEVNPFHKPHYLILNLALGGAWGGPLDDAKLPAKFLVDYVRVYQEAPKP